MTSLTLANVVGTDVIANILHSRLLGMTLEHWINDGLMVIFFLMIGLELEREVYSGELSTWKNAALPVFAAVGGMLVPAAIHAAFNLGTETARGIGIPMATDIAFSLGLLSLFASRVPYSLKIFLAALAIADDLGAIIVIAVFYSKQIEYGYLIGATTIFSGLMLLNRMRVQWLAVYLVGGIGMWFCLLSSGVHATIGGVLLAFTIPFSRRREDCISHRLQHRLHYPVAMIVLPIFAFANTCIPLRDDWYLGLLDRNALGIFLGLVVGKSIGIFAFCLVAILLRLGRLPDSMTYRHLWGAGLFAGIGFTMSIFISSLAFDSQERIDQSQIVVLLASVVSIAVGSLWFVTMISKVTMQAADPPTDDLTEVGAA